MALTKEQKEKIIDDLIGNEGLEGDGPWKEDHREALNAMPEDLLEGLNQQRELAANAHKFKDGDAEYEESEENKKKVFKKNLPKHPTKNEETPENGRETVANQGPMTVQEWMDKAPPEIRSVVTNALNFEKKQRQELVKEITANKKCPFTVEYLNGRTMEELQGLAILATNKEEKESAQSSILTPHYAGVVGAPAVHNMGIEDDFANQDQDMVPNFSDDWMASGK